MSGRKRSLCAKRVQTARDATAPLRQVISLLHDTAAALATTAAAAPPTAAPASFAVATGASAASAPQLAPHEEMQKLHDGLYEELKRWLFIEQSRVTSDGRMAEENGADDEELCDLQDEIASILVTGCLGNDPLTLEQVPIDQLASAIQRVNTRRVELQKELRARDDEDEQRLTLWLKEHKLRMSAHSEKLQAEWDAKQDEDEFLNSSEQRAAEQDARDKEFVNRELQRRKLELEQEYTEQGEREQRQLQFVSPEKAAEMEQERLRKEEKMQKLRQSERARAARKGYATNPNYQPPQEFAFGQ